MTVIQALNESITRFWWLTNDPTSSPDDESFEFDALDRELFARSLAELRARLALLAGVSR